MYVFHMVQRRHPRHAPRQHGPVRRHGPRGARCRRPLEDGGWEVHARVERFVEPALLLLLRDSAAHGYDLADGLGGLVPDERVDLGNLYRLLRSLEHDGLVVSEWRDDLPGKAKRTYELTDAGEHVLDAWATALRTTRETITRFLREYEKGTSP